MYQYESIEGYTVNDIQWTEEYKYHPSIKMEMIA